MWPQYTCTWTFSHWELQWKLKPMSKGGNVGKIYDHWEENIPK